MVQQEVNDHYIFMRDKKKELIAGLRQLVAWEWEREKTTTSWLIIDSSRLLKWSLFARRFQAYSVS